MRPCSYGNGRVPTRGHLLNMDNFIDTSSAEGRFDYSEWVRAYGRYLDEQLEVYAKINYYQVRLRCTTPTVREHPSALLNQDVVVCFGHREGITGLSSNSVTRRALSVGMLLGPV